MISAERRRVLRGLAAAGGTSLISGGCRSRGVPRPLTDETSGPSKLMYRTSLTRGVFGPAMRFEKMCAVASELGCAGFDLIPFEDWPTLAQFGLRPTLARGSVGTSILRGLADTENPRALEQSIRKSLGECVAGKCPHLLVFAGSRRGLGDEQAMDRCVALLRGVAARAEDIEVTICVELLNSKEETPDYLANHTSWGVELCKRVSSPCVRLLYDIYHMQIMEGDITATIRANIEWIAHFHAAGVPGRHELGDDQELNYRYIIRSIGELGFRGIIGLEYKPAPGTLPVAALRRSLGVLQQAPERRISCGGGS